MLASLARLLVGALVVGAAVTGLLLLGHGPARFGIAIALIALAELAIVLGAPARFRGLKAVAGLLASGAIVALCLLGVERTVRMVFPIAAVLLVAGFIAFAVRDPRVRGWIAAVTIDQWRAIDAETVREPGEAGRANLLALAVVGTAAFTLTIQYYWGERMSFEDWFPYEPHTASSYYTLGGFVWWSAWRLLGYVIVPMLVITALPGQRIRDYHISPRGFFRHLWIYLLLFACVLPFVILASRTQAFRMTYPFYRMANRSTTDLWGWEAAYAVQFLSLEFFFRGFILNGLRRALGSNAIFVMLVPYCMIHFGKPMPETLGAIAAGLILGTIAMRTRSIWGGVLIHLGVALTMDLFALHGCPPIGSGHFCGE